MRLLLIEDNGRIGEAITSGLTREGFAVDWRRTLEEAFEARSLAVYDLVLLDLGLPDGDGLDVVRRMRRERDATPILILTARGELGDRVTGLDLGADDYLVKPFEVPELAARCRALLRRPGACLGVVLQAGNVSLDTASRTLVVRGAPVHAQRREIALIEQLLRRVGQVVIKSALEDQIYSMDAEVTPNALEAVVSRLRRHLAAAGADVTLKTVHGVGYALLAPTGAEAAHA
jgi:DNA-binding response OmpR family regulator